MSHQHVIFNDVSFTYDTAVSPLLEGFSAHFPSGWTGVVGANGSGKSTLLKLAVGDLVPRGGRVDIPDHAIYCPQRTDEPPPMLDLLLEAADAEAFKKRNRLGIGSDWLERWPTLSHGERKRAQIGTALWLEPLVLAVDEPTNHLDLPSIRCLEEALSDCPCGLLLVSHDERFLDALTCTRWQIVMRKKNEKDYQLSVI